MLKKMIAALLCVLLAGACALAEEAADGLNWMDYADYIRQNGWETERTALEDAGLMAWLPPFMALEDTEWFEVYGEKLPKVIALSEDGEVRAQYTILGSVFGPVMYSDQWLEMGFVKKDINGSPAYVYSEAGKDKDTGKDSYNIETLLRVGEKTYYNISVTCLGETARDPDMTLGWALLSAVQPAD